MEGGLGIRCCTNLNRAHSLKLWWKLVEKKDDLAVWNLFVDNLKWGLGNGDKIPVWEGEWLNGHRLREFLIGPLPKDADKLTLSACYVNGIRDDTILGYPIPPHIATIWDNIHFSPFNDFSFSWFTEKGKFSFRKAMQAQALDQTPKDEETSDHILRTCTFAKDVWNLIQPGIHSEFFTTPLNIWLDSNCSIHTSTQSSSTIPWHILFPFIIWSLWLRRNDLIFSNISSSPNACLDKAKALALEFYIYQSKSFTGPNSSVISHLTWQPPPPLKWMLNVDASFSSNLKLAGLGGVIRDHHGSWIKGFQKSCSAASTLMAEQLAILYGLKLLESLNASDVTLCSDSANALRFVEDTHLGRDEHANILHECRQLIQGLQVTLMHTRRQSNQLGDALAKLCRKNCNSLGAMTILDQPLAEPRLLYEVDKPP